MYLIAKIRKKSYINNNKIICTINLNNKKNILLSIDNNKYYYNIFKKKNIYKIKILNKIYNSLISKINYHPFIKRINNIEFKEINDNI